jgi:chitinase
MTIIEGTECLFCYSGIQCLVRTVSASATFTHVRLNSAISFLLLEGAWDKVVCVVSSSPDGSRIGQAEEWTQLTAAQRSSLKASYNAAGIKLVVSAFGSTDAPTSSGADPVATANTMAAWVIQYGLDGIDVDYEVMSVYSGWLICQRTTGL